MIIRDARSAPRRPERVRRAVAAVAVGGPVVVVDDTGRADEGALAFAAQLATTRIMAFTVRHTSGFVCAALIAGECERLRLPPMTGRDPAHRVAVDRRGTGTGISAAARAATVAALGDPATLAADLVRPGHVVPLRAHDSGVLGRQGLGEVAVDLARMAGLHPAGVLSEIVSVERPGRMACRDELARFALHHGLPIVSIGEIVDARLRSEPQVERGPSASLPTAHGVFRAIGFRGVHDDAEHLALVAGQLGSRSGDGQAVLVHVHVECLAGDVFGSCACGAVLDDALAMIAAAGRGVVVYTRPPGAARACGLLADPATSRLPGRNLAAAVLRDLGVTSARVPDSDPHLVAVLADYGIAVDAARHAVAG